MLIMNRRGHFVVAEALPKIACVDSSGTLQIELLEEMIAYGSSGDEDEVSGDFAPGLINKTEINSNPRNLPLLPYGC